ncbi:MAG: hypothetical protein RXR08_12575 [Sulfolobaceae archaeon]
MVEKHIRYFIDGITTQRVEDIKKALESNLTNLDDDIKIRNDNNDNHKVLLSFRTPANVRVMQCNEIDELLSKAGVSATRIIVSKTVTYELEGTTSSATGSNKGLNVDLLIAVLSRLVGYTEGKMAEKNKKIILFCEKRNGTWVIEMNRNLGRKMKKYSIDEELLEIILHDEKRLCTLYQQKRKQIEEKRKQLGTNKYELSLSDLEDMSMHFIDLLLIKCGNPTLKRNIRTRQYKRHLFNVELFLAIYYAMQNYDVETIIERIKQLSSKCVDRKRSYFNVSDEDLNEIETYYNKYVEMEEAILKLNKDESCYILNTLIQM